MKKLRISAVSYLNTKPFLYGLVNSDFKSNFEIELAHPSACAVQLKNGQADIGLVPIALAKEMPGGKIISNYCIGTEGTVKTVCLFSKVPIEEVEKIILDYQSKTSVALVQLLMKKYWKKEVIWESGQPGFENEIKNKTAGLVIGDRTIELLSQYPFCYDLGEIWKKYTGLPFVFAVWMTYSELDERLIQIFNQALQLGIQHIDALVYLIPPQWKSTFDVATYLREHISYHLDAPKIEGMYRFLKEIGVGDLPPIIANQKSTLVN